MPVLDVPSPGSHDIIGDRAYGADPAQVAALGRAVAEGHMAGGVLPVIKHVPGHGRATADSHLELPVVTAPRAELERIDFAAFRPCADLPAAMTAHVVYEAIDPDRPASTSPRVIAEVVRGAIGFDGLLMSDDLGMQALSGSMAERTRGRAGCGLRRGARLQRRLGRHRGGGRRGASARRRRARSLRARLCHFAAPGSPSRWQRPSAASPRHCA